MPLISFIPKRYEEGFRKIAALEEEDFQLIKQALERTQLVSSIGKLIMHVVEISGSNEDDIEDIFLSVGSLISFLESEDVYAEVVTDVTMAGYVGGLFENKGQFHDRLSYLIKCKQIYYSYKANHLATEYGNVFLSSRIATDIRPVFSANLEDAPRAAMVIHNLHIHFQSDEEDKHKDIFFALDSDDLKTLKNAIIRAEQKEIGLKKVFENSGMINTETQKVIDSHSLWRIQLPTERKLSKLETQFNELAAKWKDETGLFSTTFHKVANDAYLDIIGMGKDAIPLILKDLQKPTGTAHWHTALKAITKENPVPVEDLTKNKKIKEAWIAWGKSKNII